MRYTSAMVQTFDSIPWEGPAVGLLDLDAFFASVEQLDHPEWRGKPLIVGGSPDKRGVVSTASYEARRFGVHSAMASATAQRLCPHAIWTSGNYARYREMSAKVMAIIGNETPFVEQVSIDEAFFDVSPGKYAHESPVDICRRIQGRVAELGITCSIGLGINKTVAKIASDLEKPRGLTIVYPGTEARFLAPLPVKKMSGIGPSTSHRLEELGIRTLGQLARANPSEMERHFGVGGPRMVMRAAGLERSKVARIDAPDEVKSVSNERTFEHDLVTGDEVRAAVRHIADLVGRRLRKKGLAGTTVTLKVKYDALTSRSAQTQLRHPTDDERVFGPVAVDLLSGLWQEGIPVRLLGVGVSGFDAPASEQLQLFDATEEQPTHDTTRLSAATDAVRKRFGDDALSYGHDLKFKGRVSDTAPMNK